MRDSMVTCKKNLVCLLTLATLSVSSITTNTNITTNITTTWSISTQSQDIILSTTQISDPTSPTSSNNSSIQSLRCPLAKSDNSGAIGGVLGTLLIISVGLNIGLIEYFKRKMKSLASTTSENTYDGTNNTGCNPISPFYDSLQVESGAMSDYDEKMKSDITDIYYDNAHVDSLTNTDDVYYVNVNYD